MADKGPPLPKFGDWDVNDPASAEGFTVIFNKARNEKKTGGTVQSPPNKDSTYNKHDTATFGKHQRNGSAALHKGNNKYVFFFTPEDWSLSEAVKGHAGLVI